MKTFTTIKEFLRFRKTIISKKLSLVPTMGDIHDGHKSLIDIAKKKSDLVVVSLFVNPIQFTSIDEYNSYPDTLKRDKDILVKQGVDILFCPNKTPPRHYFYLQILDDF